MWRFDSCVTLYNLGKSLGNQPSQLFVHDINDTTCSSFINYLGKFIDYTRPSVHEQ